MPDSADRISVEFRLSWEEWRDARHIDESDAKSLKVYQADYLRFGAEQRSFSADESGWTYSYSSGKASHEWTELIGVGQLHSVIVLMASSCHYTVPKAAFEKNQLVSLQHWIDLAMS